MKITLTIDQPGSVSGTLTIERDRLSEADFTLLAKITSSVQDAVLPTTVRVLAPLPKDERGNTMRIGAIKEFRNACPGMTLVEAKNLVEEVETKGMADFPAADQSQNERLAGLLRTNKFSVVIVQKV
jgi:hypothetical protein